MDHPLNSLVFIQSYEDALAGNNLHNNLQTLFRYAERIEMTKGNGHYGESEPIESGYKNYSNPLARYALELDQKRTLLKKIYKTIRDLSIATQGPIKSTWIHLLNTLKISINDKSYWEDFKVCFEEINPDFVEKLAQQYPVLTSRDLKYCCYLKMNMSNEDIRNLLGISQESVRTHKYRLKRKLTLSKEQDLRFFLSTYTQ